MYHEVLNPGVRDRITKASDELFISELLTNTLQTRDVFRGTFAVNERVSKPTVLPAGYIYNTHPRSSSVVGHWICIYVYMSQRKLYVEFFGSYGLKPPDQLLTMTQSWTRHVCWNRHLYQSSTSLICGMYCVYFLYYRCFGWSMKQIKAHFTTNTLTNDKLVQDSIFTLVSH